MRGEEFRANSTLSAAAVFNVIGGPSWNSGGKVSGRKNVGDEPVAFARAAHASEVRDGDGMSGMGARAHISLGNTQPAARSSPGIHCFVFRYGEVG
jgi:hypothetical protein